MPQDPTELPTSLLNPPITPVPVPAAELPRVHSLLLVGGSFDPPHLGHARVPAALRAAAFPGGPCASSVWLMYVPAAHSPFKQQSPVAPDADRLAMVKVAIGDMPSACVWTDELDRAAAGDPGLAGPSYTIDTVRRARAWLDAHDAANVSLRVVIGADQAATFHLWRDPRDIIALAEPLVMGRKGIGQTEQILQSMHDANFWTHEEINAWRRRIHDLATVGIELSSTQLRAQLAAGVDCSRLLHPGVSSYIRAHALYRA